MIASLIVKVFGAIFKIPLTNIIGVTSMAYFNTAYGFYVIFYMISTAGVPVAVSKMVSEADAKSNKKEIDRIFKASYLMFFVFGVIGSLLMVLFSKRYADYVKLDGLHWAIITISITLFFMCITSAYRGYFQGLKNMTPTAVSQVIGAVGKLFVGLLFAVVAVKVGFDSPLVAAFTLLGITSGSIGSTIYLAAYKKVCDKKEPQRTEDTSQEATPFISIVKKLIVIAIPITLSATILSLTNTIDTTLMIRRLVSSGIIKDEATKIMGAYTSMSVPLNNLAPNLIYPFAVSVIPAITGMFTAGNENEAKKVIASTLRIASVIAIPCSIGLMLFSRPIVSLLYESNETIALGGEMIAETDVAAGLLSVLATSIFFVAMVSVTNAVLQAYGKEKLTIFSTLIGITAKIVLNYVLIGNATVGMYGAPIATVTCYASIAVLNFIFIACFTDYLPNVLSTSLRPLIASAVSIGVCRLVYHFVVDDVTKETTVIFIVLSAILYFASTFLFKCINSEDIKMLPKGKKIEKLLKKLKFIK